MESTRKPERVRVDELAGLERLDADQFQHAVYMAMPRRFRPKRERIAEMLNVSVAKLGKWERMPEFQFVRRQMTFQYFSAFVPDVIEAIRVKGEAGDVPAARLFLEFVRELKTEAPAAETDELSEEELEQRLHDIRMKTGMVVEATVEPCGEQVEEHRKIPQG